MTTRGDRELLGKGRFRIELSFRQTSQPKGLFGGQPVADVLKAKVDFTRGTVLPGYHRELTGEESFLQLDAGWGLTRRTTVFGSLPLLAHRSYRISHGGLLQAYDVLGTGDGVVGVRHILWSGQGTLMGGLAVKLPTGRSALIDTFDLSILDPMLQPGTGSWDGVVSMQYSAPAVAGFGSWASLSYQRTSANARGYRFGDERIASVGASRSVGDVSLSLQLKSFHKDRSRFQDLEVPGTGMRFLYLTPGVRLKAPGQLTLYVYVPIPVSRYVNDSQLVPITGYLLGASRTF
jgi:hypothetical protein